MKYFSGNFAYHMSHVCNHGTDQSDRRMNVARFCDLTCTLELWTGTCFASTESADSSHARLQISALGLIFAISHGWKFVVFFFFELKSFLVEFYFFELSLFESSIGSMMINTISPGSRGSLAASWPASGCHGGPRFSHTAPAARRDCIFVLPSANWWERIPKGPSQKFAEAQWNEQN